MAPLGERAVAPPEVAPAPAKATPVAVTRSAAPSPVRAAGTLAIDARIDLHGMTQQAAHGRLVRFLKEAQADGVRLALVITGKGRPGDGGFGGERGVLRRSVPLWLSGAEMRPYVVGFGEAAPPHGGTGALYVRIRRARG